MGYQYHPDDLHIFRAVAATKAKGVPMTPEEILQGIQQRAAATLNASVVTDPVIRERVDYVCRCMSNRAGVRLLMSCLLGKLDKPNVDPRKPYTEIGGTDSFSGRTYDERHLTKFINEHRLPVNPTTAFLTPTLRNIDHALTTDRELVTIRLTWKERMFSKPWRPWVATRTEIPMVPAPNGILLPDGTLVMHPATARALMNQLESMRDAG